jgi:CDP-diacylglycerol---glycerol-3-phosphate 3-phosphatidyltransferase
MTRNTIDVAISTGIFGLWALGLIYYSFRTVIVGRYRTARVDQMGGTRLFSAWLMEFGYWFVHGIANFFIRVRVGPNLITIFSLLTAIASAVALYLTWFGLGGWLMIAAALLDIMDGWVARALGVAGEAGEYFDSVIDRYCELVGFIAVMGYYFPQQPLPAIIVGLAMTASIMITFNRAKGEAQGVTDVPSGLMRRHERYVYIGVGTAASPILAHWLEPGAVHPTFHLAIAAFALVAIVGNIAAIRLAVQVHRRLREMHPVGGNGAAAAQQQGPQAPPTAEGPQQAGPQQAGTAREPFSQPQPSAGQEPAPALSTAEVAGGKIEEGSRVES